jgi:co-chaperonin GroES (HSP10)
MNKLNPIKNNILFTFLQEMSHQNGFENKTDWGFSVLSKTTDMKKGRWAEVLHIGPDVKDVKIGDYVFIEPLAWTNKLTLENNNYWMTNEDKILLISEEKPKEFE